MPNKYINMELDRNHTDNLSSLRYEELDLAFSSCYESKELNSSAVIIEGSCRGCLDHDQTAYMTAMVEGFEMSPFVERVVRFKFVCTQDEDIHFPGQV